MPLGQLIQLVEVWELEPMYLPAWHATHELEDLYLPAPHTNSLHSDDAVAPVPDVVLPLPQLMQLDAPEPAYLPFAQLSQYW